MPSCPGEKPTGKPSMMRLFASAVIAIGNFSLMLGLTSKAGKRNDSWAITPAEKLFNCLNVSESERQEPSRARIFEYLFDGLGLIMF